MKKSWNLSNDAWILWLMALPGVAYFIIFKYTPMLGNVIAFQEYNIFQGIFNSPWVGFKQFIKMFEYPEFMQIFRNTLILSFYTIVFGFPAPLLFALLLNEVRWMFFKRVTQTLVYLPHFLSWVIVGGIFINLLSYDGIINTVLAGFGLEKPIDFITQSHYFRGILVITDTWKEVGWGTIIYLAAITAVNPNLYEAAMVDGAGRWKQIWHITLPSIMSTIIVLFLLKIGTFMESNFEQIYIFLNPLVRDVGEVIDTYVFRVGFQGSKFSYTTAIGIFKSIIGLVLIVSLNNISKKTTGESLY
ncbi:ABC transporter permease [Paenibacillus eucommiae]|uniref:Aldouronate transport system permease protein n=1 Tax=Paenibacillus eucommiae TaxID=1355755 RepID=A0ABS4J033_9BACL|nr:ABC transporter permease subunit [Paenibacillus eucommiae]MBP1993200.1 putative aldouronate transport system permease protein [Paenibacillus eucommiae]